MPSDQISWSQAWPAFVKSSKEHWKKLIGESAVALILGVLAAVGFNVPPLIAGVLALGLAVVAACWLAFKDQYGKVIALEERLKSRITASCSDDEQMQVSG